jgi:hypothetical protein
MSSSFIGPLANYYTHCFEYYFIQRCYYSVVAGNSLNYFFIIGYSIAMTVKLIIIMSFILDLYLIKYS